MANAEHVDIVKSGPLEILQWNARHPNMPLDLAGADLSETRLDGCVLNGANLQRARLNRATLINTQLERCDLSYADLTFTRLIRSNLRGGILMAANVLNAELYAVDLTAADLRWSFLTGATLNQVNVKDARLAHAICGGTSFCNFDLSGAEGLETVKHHSPSTVGVDTLYLSQANIPRSFLEGCGVPNALIDYFVSTRSEPVSFYSCFISYTKSDNDFSLRLYTDLREAGIRSWRWDEDAKWGDTLIGAVDRAIREHDKLIVVCTANSLRSEPVIREIERALQREQAEHRNVLFPIRLDDALFKWDHALQADVVRKVVGDFCNWPDEAQYQKSLKRLLNDLRQDSSVGQ